MSDYRPATYGDMIGDAYEGLYGDFPPDPHQIDLLVTAAASGTAVEVGAGTGRIALPVAAQGVPVIGVDASHTMTRVLADRANAQRVPVTAVCADAAGFDDHVPEPVPLVFAVFNTFFLLAEPTTQEAFLDSSVRALRPGGRLVIETFVPRPGILPDGPHPGVFPTDRVVTVKHRTPERLVLFAATNDPANQSFDYHEVVLEHGEPVCLYPGRMRYHWPREIDAMATQAGLRLTQRWGDWDKRPYTPRSPKHVSVYERS
jgi:SAM-dependent methyltransferase